MLQDLISSLSGALVGAILALVGGGGSVLAVPLLVYGVGLSSVHTAIGTSALAVSVSAFLNLLGYWRAGQVKWRCGLVFATAGVVGALVGSTVGKMIDSSQLLGAFGALMIVVGIITFLKRSAQGNPGVRLTRDTATVLVPGLVSDGFGVGTLSGFFGIGGGFLIVPALMSATGMTQSFAIATSLVAVIAFGATTASSYALSGMIDWRVAILFIVGGGFGGLIGMEIGRRVSRCNRKLGSLLAALIVLAGTYIVVASFFLPVD
jgi:uncharacterized protein